MEAMNEGADVDIRHWAAVVWRYRWSILSIMVLAVAFGWWQAGKEVPTYRASATLLIEVGSFERLTGDQLANDLDRMMANELDLISSDVVRSEVEEVAGRPLSVSVRRLGLFGDAVEFSATGTDPEAVAANVNDFSEAYVAIRLRETQAVIDNFVDENTVELEASEAALTILLGPLVELDAQLAAATGSLEEQNRAQRLRDAEASRVAIPRRSLETSVDNTTQRIEQAKLFTLLAEGSSASIITPARVPGAPFADGARRVLLTFIAIGLGVALAQAALRARLDDRMAIDRFVERLIEPLPILARLPHDRDLARPGGTDAIALSQPKALLSEGFRSLRTSIELSFDISESRAIHVTSAMPGEGKSLVAMNLGIVFAQAGLRVLVVDGDMRRPRLHTFFHMNNDVGLSSVLSGTHSLTEAVKPVPALPTMCLLCAGPTPEGPSELLRSGSAAALFDALRNSFDLVIVDGPPVVPVADSLVLGHVVGATIVVARRGETSAVQFAEAWGSLERSGVRLLGAVYNGEKSRARSYTYYGDAPKRRLLPAFARRALPVGSAVVGAAAPHIPPGANKHTNGPNGAAYAQPAPRAPRSNGNGNGQYVQQTEALANGLHQTVGSDQPTNHPTS